MSADATILELELSRFRREYMDLCLAHVDRPIEVCHDPFWTIDHVAFSHCVYGQSMQQRIYHSGMIGATSKVWTLYTMRVLERDMTVSSDVTVDAVRRTLQFLQVLTELVPRSDARTRSVIAYMCAVCVDYVNGCIDMGDVCAVRRHDPVEFRETLKFIHNTFRPVAVAFLELARDVPMDFETFAGSPWFSCPGGSVESH